MDERRKEGTTMEWRNDRTKQTKERTKEYTNRQFTDDVAASANQNEGTLTTV